MPTAVISDVHANLSALQAVLADIDGRRSAGLQIDRIISLGDIVGYGPDPLQCVDLVRERCQWSLMGNHDFGVLYEPTNFNPGAEAAAYWTREQFDAEPDESLRKARYDFLDRLRVRVVDTQWAGTGNGAGGAGTGGVGRFRFWRCTGRRGGRSTSTSSLMT